jgi:hypothetical protein
MPTRSLTGMALAQVVLIGMIADGFFGMFRRIPIGSRHLRDIVKFLAAATLAAFVVIAPARADDAAIAAEYRAYYEAKKAAEESGMPTPQPPQHVPRYPPARSGAWLPPLEYDHPYTGKLHIIRADKNLLLKKCSAPLGLGADQLACADPSENECVIFLASNDILEITGWSEEILLRHEIGHCNGWPGNHPNPQWIYLGR